MQFKLEDWFLCLCGTSVVAFGRVYGKSDIVDGGYIHTSQVEAIELNNVDGTILITTNSGSTYAMDMAKFNYDFAESTELCLELLDYLMGGIDEEIIYKFNKGSII